MPHPNSYHPPRRPRSNTQEPYRVRRRGRVNQVTADHGQRPDRNAVDDQTIVWRNPSQDEEATAVSYSGTSVSGVYVPSDQALWPEPAVRDTIGIDGTLNSSHYSAHVTFGESVQEGLPHQLVRYGQTEASLSPEVSPTDGVAAVSETTYDLSEPDPWSAYQVGQTDHVWAAPTRQGWEISSDPVDRRWSMHARQGSVAAFSGDSVAPILGSSDIIQEHDSSGVRGDDTTPEDRVREFVSGEGPWSPGSLAESQGTDIYTDNWIMWG
ncbi:hypothetical protein EV127DRAFT_157028 [Xylaria flabelliformis]|nr:hypothetical protein EV127DRAFT_157028 [Xylaria flabelliformis]